MIARSFAAALLLLCFAHPAAAQQNCIAPFAPAIPDGATASEEEMTTVRDQVVAFLSDSDSYQSCLVVYIRQMEDDARHQENRPVDQGLRSHIVDLINANQRLKERTGNAYNTAVRDHNAANAPAPESVDGAAQTGEGRASQDSSQ